MSQLKNEKRRKRQDIYQLTLLPEGVTHGEITRWWTKTSTDSRPSLQGDVSAKTICYGYTSKAKFTAKFCEGRYDEASIKLII